MIVNADSWQRPSGANSHDLQRKVGELLARIESEGDAFIDELSQQFDGFSPEYIRLKPFSEYDLEPELAQAIQDAAARIERFAQFQKQSLASQSFSDECGDYQQRIIAIENAGCYIPGGRFPLISTALMTLIPAKVAGCKRRVAVSPSAHPGILAAASLAGATEFIKIGGVQAIGALAFGYQDTGAADVIVGPGNAYVNQAKALLQYKLKIDGLAGPSELMALCDGNQPIEWLAYDALAQSEHDPMAVSVLVSDDHQWLGKMADYLQSNQQFEQLVSNQQVVLLQADSAEHIIEISNQFAAEHLMLCHQDIEQNALTHYGSLFVGANSAVAFGDYCSGPNHTLPTMGFARQTGGLNVQTFLRIQTVQSINDQGRTVLGNIAMPLADAEGLVFHYESMKVRQ